MSKFVGAFGTHIVFVTGPIASGKSSLVEFLCGKRSLSSTFVHFNVDEQVAAYVETDRGRDVIEAIFGVDVFKSGLCKGRGSVDKRKLREAFFSADEKVRNAWEVATMSYLLEKLAELFLRTRTIKKKKSYTILVECATPDFVKYLVGNLNPLFVILTDREQKDILCELFIRNPDYTEKLARKIIEVQDSKLKTFKPGIPVLGMRWSSERKKQNGCARSVSGFVKMLQHGV